MEASTHPSSECEGSKVSSRILGRKENPSSCVKRIFCLSAKLVLAQDDVPNFVVLAQDDVPNFVSVFTQAVHNF
jgi:hypothetical protein